MKYKKYRSVLLNTILIVLFTVGLTFHFQQQERDDALKKIRMLNERRAELQRQQQMSVAAGGAAVAANKINFMQHSIFQSQVKSKCLLIT